MTHTRSSTSMAAAWFRYPRNVFVVEKLGSSAVRISPSGYGLYGSELDKGASVAGCIPAYPTEKK